MINRKWAIHRFVGIFLLLCIIASPLRSQTILEVIGRAEQDMEPIANAKATLTKDGKTIQTVYTDSHGEFKFSMDINSEYVIEISKAGMLPKKIAFNTELPTDVTGRWTMEFAMSLFPGCEGVNTSALDDPVDRIKFSTNKSDFISDEGYVRTMRGRIERLMIDIENCENEKYQEAMEEGNNLMKEGNYVAAQEKFSEALDIYPDDRNAQRKIAEAEKSMGNSQMNERAYSEAIAEADRLAAAGDYVGAKAKYAEALRRKQDSYAQSKLAEMDRQISAQQQAERDRMATDGEYNQLLAQANAAYARKDYATAQQYYQQASQVKPDAAFPKQKLNELAPLIAAEKQNAVKQQALEKSYTEAIAMAQSALQAKDYEAAKQHFRRAQMMKPDESYPQQKIREIDNLVEQDRQAAAQAQKAAQQQKIRQALDEGDQLMAQKDYEGAEAAYQRALALDPNDNYAQQQVRRTRSMQASVAAEKQQTLQREFNDAVNQGDELASTGSYDRAITAYKQALLKKPDDPAVQAKLRAAEQQLNAQKQQELREEEKKRQYENYLANGNRYFDARQYAEAKQSYQQALTLYPTQSVPRNRIGEIDRILAQQEKETQYRDIITRADGHFAAKDYEAAKTGYQQALAMNSTDPYPRQKIAEIDNIARDNARLENERKQREATYTRTIQEADNLLALKRYQEARSAFQRAMDLKPDETYPQQQITRIDGILAAEQQRATEERAKEEQYKTLISRADGLFTSGEYDPAKSAYQEALTLKSTETYPRQRIAEIDRILQQQQQQAAQQRMRDEQYTRAVREADNLFNTSRLQEAKSAYQRALSIKATETYPQQQITRIDGIMAEQARKENEQRQLEQQYAQAIAQADQAWGRNELVEAKTAYQQALRIKPGEEYPTSQIARIDGQLAQQAREQQERAAFEQKYNNLIASADRAYDSRDYPTAKNGYMEALKLKPNESYPQERLNKIAEFERIIARQQSNRTTSSNTSTTTASQTNSPKPGKLADLNFANDSEREKYLNSLRAKYPPGVTMEVHKEKTKTTWRYVIIRGNEVREFRKVKFNWGGVEFSDNGIPTTGQYFDSQVKVRPGEAYQEFSF